MKHGSGVFFEDEEPRGKEKEKTKAGQCASVQTTSKKTDGGKRLALMLGSKEAGQHSGGSFQAKSTLAIGSSGRRSKEAGAGGSSGGRSSGNPIVIESSIHEYSGEDDDSLMECSYETDSDESDDGGRNIVQFELDYPFKSYLDLWRCRGYWGTTRFICINTQSGRIYKVKLVRRSSSYYALTTGWSLLVTVEGFRRGQNVRFEYHASHLELTTNDAILAEEDETGPAGFVSSEEAGQFKRHNYFIGENTRVGHFALTALGTAWMVGAPRNPMFICTVRESQEGSQAMFFSMEFSKKLPVKEMVALRFFGSSIVICGAIHGYENGPKRITKGWDQFVLEHRIEVGDVLVFRCYRGPSVWEMMVCRAAFGDHY